jgi:hypothetical protein
MFLYFEIFDILKLIRLKEKRASQEDASCSSSEESGYEEVDVSSAYERSKYVWSFYLRFAYFRSIQNEVYVHVISLGFTTKSYQINPQKMWHSLGTTVIY